MRQLPRAIQDVSISPPWVLDDTERSPSCLLLHTELRPKKFPATRPAASRGYCPPGWSGETIATMGVSHRRQQRRDRGGGTRRGAGRPAVSGDPDGRPGRPRFRPPAPALRPGPRAGPRCRPAADAPPTPSPEPRARRASPPPPLPRVPACRAHVEPVAAGRPAHATDDVAVRRPGPSRFPRSPRTPGPSPSPVVNVGSGGAARRGERADRRRW